MIGQVVGAYTNATHGMTLSAVSIPYYRYIMPDGLAKLVRYAINVWGVKPDGKTQEQIAEEGLQAMERYMREIGVVMNLAELGVTEEMISGIVAATLPMMGGYREMAPEDIKAVLKKSL